MSLAAESIVQELIEAKLRKQKCIAGKTEAVDKFVNAVEVTTSAEKETSVIKALVFSIEASAPERRRGPTGTSWRPLGCIGLVLLLSTREISTIACTVKERRETEQTRLVPYWTTR